MKKSAWYVILLLVVLAVAVVIAFTNPEFSGWGKDDEPTPPANTPAIPMETPQTKPDELPGESTRPDETEEPSPEPTPTPSPTPAPTPTPTPTPTPSPTPTPTPTPVPTAKGSFVSDTGTYLNLQVEWEVYDENGTAKLRIDVYASHYSFNTSALYNAVNITVNGSTYSMSSAEVSYDGDELTKTLLASHTMNAPAGSFSIDVVWNYRGSYSGVQLDTIEAYSGGYVG